MYIMVNHKLDRTDVKYIGRDYIIQFNSYQEIYEIDKKTLDYFQENGYYLNSTILSLKDQKCKVFYTVDKEDAKNILNYQDYGWGECDMCNEENECCNQVDVQGYDSSIVCVSCLIDLANVEMNN